MSKKKLTEAQQAENELNRKAIAYLKDELRSLPKEIEAEKTTYETHQGDPEWLRIYGDLSKRRVHDLEWEIVRCDLRIRELQKALY